MPAPVPRVPASARLGLAARTLFALPVCASLLWLMWNAVYTPTESHGASFDPDAHRWRHRLLLVFAIRPADPDVAAQQEALAAQPAALDDRDLVVATLFDEADGVGGGQPITSAQTASLRARYGVASGAFTVLLIGKDGGVKLRAERPIGVDAIAGLIDTMPMRQAEMREREQPSE